jgi:hypothetical protein
MLLVHYSTAMLAATEQGTALTLVYFAKIASRNCTQQADQAVCKMKPAFSQHMLRQQLPRVLQRDCLMIMLAA